MIDVFLLLGSNLGDRQAFLSNARDHIETDVAPIISVSSVYETQSWGKTDQPDYLNQVLYLKTDVPARVLLEKILHIEMLMGRKREEKWGSRIIDIDILFYGQEIISETDLNIPHPELHKRMFTLEPLNEITPHFIHPVLNKSIFELKSELKSDLHVKKL
ncbi:2-amino-4-hydroxy-6-hydroxymethyldihydropteridine diphosphokinase [Mucilaginibacter sp.]|jgi:2-amino-4-hydroxy-6-hydroxymethyldihydropteridine diphosphokinase|uniref:2-amino-4-hydroxy-6- hydroxymethyldihydropteridine diphosphokinase n=1 Tax=Mucilaginibacter sp. TaxID=1882438 RepID=UPI002CAFB6B9|nr:2-amino-4-hydroxy-6-hydroxymethyldihydropteridine diphosphokinase [Mucilaginibacter sp.]HTI58013.1 2-amino-4-hydroxy-6-hydroxymethyldihydropteridine diphosphokinase [Mucilaginibacter sp.]